MQITRRGWKGLVLSGGEQTLNVTPEDADDIWALYNLIGAGDEVECATLRKVLRENASGDVVDSAKVKMVLAVRVEKLDVDLHCASLRVNGKNVRENEWVKLGSYHTLDVEPGRWVKITKTHWDALAVELLEQALASIGKVEIGAIAMQEGLAHICSLSPHGTRVLQRIEVAMPRRKLGPTSQSEKAMEKFMGQCLEGLLAHLRPAALKAIVIASTEAPLRDELYRRLLERAQADGLKPILENKSKFMRVAVPSGQPTALEAVLREPRIATLLADTKAAVEGRVLDEFHKIHNHDPERTTFGPAIVAQAADQCAVRDLLISDTLFRSLDVAERKSYAAIVGSVRENGGTVTIFATGSAPEQELAKLSGIAAILHFPLTLPE